MNLRLLATSAALALASMLLPGCAGSEETATTSTPAVGKDLTVEIVSLPRGCVVEMNGEYLGGTPLKISVPATPDGCWTGPSSVTHVISVSTPNNRFVETKKWHGGDRIPQRLLFRPPYSQH